METKELEVLHAAGLLQEVGRQGETVTYALSWEGRTLLKMNTQDAYTLTLLSSRRASTKERHDWAGCFVDTYRCTRTSGREGTPTRRQWHFLVYGANAETRNYWARQQVEKLHTQPESYPVDGSIFTVTPCAQEGGWLRSAEAIYAESPLEGVPR